jgi:hypothetical protein
MTELAPDVTIGILPGHPAMPTRTEVLFYETSLRHRHVNTLVPELPAAMKDYGDAVPADIWAEPQGFPAGADQLRGMEELQDRLVGVNGLLIVNTHIQCVQSYGGGLAAIRNSVSDRVSTPASFFWEELGVPVALVHAPKHKGGDTRNGDLNTRIGALSRLGATIIGVGLEHWPEFLERINPDVAITAPPEVSA